ncbi:MAG: hypothetical protein B5M48_01620 [Candidatus Omnitrophica bacterium 4484_213]|nr:MAG: hypothetical protein B5M48_01620 [Candidatus Omnitrophica bacterium 4484_213]
MNRNKLLIVIFLISFFLLRSMQIVIAEGDKKEPVKKPSPALSQEQVDKEQEQVNKESETTSPTPIIEIKRLDTEEPFYSFELRDAEIKDILRILGHDYNLNILIDEEVKGKVTASLRKISLEEALEKIADMQNLLLEKRGDIIVVKPNLIKKIFKLKYISVKDIFPKLAEKEREERKQQREERKDEKSEIEEEKGD